MEQLHMVLQLMVLTPTTPLQVTTSLTIHYPHTITLTPITPTSIKRVIYTTYTGTINNIATRTTTQQLSLITTATFLLQEVHPYYPHEMVSPLVMDYQDYRAVMVQD